MFQSFPCRDYFRRRHPGPRLLKVLVFLPVVWGPSVCERNCRARFFLQRYCTISEIRRFDGSSGFLALRSLRSANPRTWVNLVFHQYRVASSSAWRRWRDRLAAPNSSTCWFACTALNRCGPRARLSDFLSRAKSIGCKRKGFNAHRG